MSGTTSTLAPSRADQLLEHELTDDGQALRFERLFEERFRYALDSGVWFEWQSPRWAPVSEAVPLRAARELARLLMAQSMSLDDLKAQEAVQKWARKAQSRPRLEACLALARTSERLAIEQADLDADPDLLAVPNGVVHLPSGELREGTRDHLISKQAGVPYLESELAPTFEKFVFEIFAGDLELIEHVQRALGYALTGLTREQRWWLFYGSGANGKSTLVELVRYVMGTYAASCGFETFLSRDGASIPNDLARLAGARFVSAGEPEPGRSFAAGRVKAFTGGDVVTARYLRQEFFEFQPCAKLFFAGNSKPTVHDPSEGFWRRATLIPFEVRFDADQRDPELLEKLKAEGSGVLNWLVEGARLWYKSGLAIPDKVQLAVDEYRLDSDPIGTFLRECCVTGAGLSVNGSTLYERYKNWAQDAGHHPVSATRFGRDLGDRGFPKRKSSTVVREGVALR